LHSKKIFFLLIILNVLLFLNCGKDILTVPEISQAISEESVLQIENEDSILGVIPNEDKIIVVFENGKILRYKAKGFIKDARFQVVGGIKKPINIYDNLIIFQDKNDGMMNLFYINKMSIVYKWKKEIMKNIVYADDRIIIFGKDNITKIFDYKKGKMTGAVAIKSNLISDCLSFDEKILICSSDKIIEYDKKNNKKEIYTLPLKSSSGFFNEGNSLIYCSENMYLIRYELNKKKIIWKLKLPAKAIGKPTNVGKYIGILLRDFNLYFYNKNGSLYWWKSLGGAPFLSSVKMDENIAIALRPKKTPSIKFFNIKDKTILTYKFKKPFNSYFFCNGDIYTVSRDEDKNLSEIIKLGNQYTVVVSILPKKTVLTKDKTVEFILQPVNLIKPNFKINIFDSEKKLVFSKEIVNKEPLNFIWLPRKEGDYELVVEAISENIDKVKANTNFKVLNIKRMLYDYYYKLFSE